MARRTVVAAVFGTVLILSSSAEAHGFVRYVSTPVTPPDGYQWVRWMYAVLAMVLSPIVLWRCFAVRMRSAFAFALVVTAVAGGMLWIVGRFAVHYSTAPPPGLGPPSAVYWGLGWRASGRMFLQWNAIGLSILVAFGLILMRCWQRRFPGARRVYLLLPFIVSYLIGVLPFVATGALLHGWAGGYVNDACERNLEAIYAALEEFAMKNGNRCPVGLDFDGVYVQLQHLLKPPRSYGGIPAMICPIGGAFDKSPKAYKWDSSFSGMTFKDVSKRVLDEDRYPITCPYHGSRILVEVRRKYERFGDE